MAEMIVCPSCGQENPAGFRLCGMCGATLAGEATPARQELKVVTVLCAEFVGLASQIARRDPEDVQTLISPHHERLRSLVEHYGGTVDSLVGATAVALFGVPVAHEDDAERALRAALKRRDLAHDDRLELRIGIDTGEALVTLGAQPTAGEGAAGDWNACVRAAYDFIAECEAGSPHYQEAGVRSIRGVLRLSRGDGDGALEDTARSVELARQPKDPQILLPALGARARVCGELSRTAEAEALANELIEAGPGAAGFRQWAMGDVIWVAERLGRRRGLREALTTIARQTKWSAAATAVSTGDFARAASIYEEIGATPAEAYARLLDAQRLIEEGRRGAGEAELRRALEFFRNVGATRYIAQSESLLAMTC